MNQYRRLAISDEVYDQILRRIRTGEWKAGEKIPSESELCTLFGVSRVTVRKVLHRLQGASLVHTYQGQGSFVTDTLDQHIALAVVPALKMTEKDFEDFLQLRRAVEFKAIELAVRYAEKEDFDQLEYYYKQMVYYTENYSEQNIKNDIEADYNFHLSIICASKNRLFYSIMSHLRDVYILYLTETRKFYDGLNDSNKLKNHCQILEALRNRDAQSAIDVIEKSMEFNVRNIKPVLKKEGSEGVEINAQNQ